MQKSVLWHGKMDTRSQKSKNKQTNKQKTEENKVLEFRDAKNLYRKAD